MQTNNSTKVAGIGGFGAIVIGLILALYQVQGWEMPTALAVFLCVLLFGLLALSLGMLLNVAVIAIKQLVERHSTSAAWVCTEAPGLLDCKVDGKRALDRLSKELGRLEIDTVRLKTQLKTVSIQIDELENPIGKPIKAKDKQKLGDQLGKQINSSAIYVEKRTELYKTLTNEIVRNYGTLVASLNIAQKKDRHTAQTLILAFDSLGQAGVAGINAMTSYKEGAQLLGQSNLTRTIRIASNRLEHSLDIMKNCFSQFQNDCQRLRAELEQKCTATDSSTPEKANSQPK